MRKAKVAPAKCTFDELCRMRRDHTDSGDFSLMVEPRVVWLSEQKMGEHQKQHIQIPRHVFNRLLVWYQREANLRPLTKRERGA